MTSQTHYPLIGIDWHRNESHREWPGRNWEDAAAQLAKRYGFAEVLSNAIGQKRGGNGSGMYNRKSLYKAPAPPAQLLNAGARDLPAAPTLTDLLSPHSKLTGLSLMKAPEIMRVLRSQGFIFQLKYISGKRIFFMDKQLTSSVTNSEFRQARDMVWARKQEFVEALEHESDDGHGSLGAAVATEPSDDPLKGKKLVKIMASMWPQMPTPFNVDDLADRLRVSGYVELSKERTRLLSSIHAAKKSGHVVWISYGKYSVTEECRHRRHAPEHPKEQPEAVAKPEVAVEAEPNPPETSLPLEAYQPPREIIEVPAPQASIPAADTLPASISVPSKPTAIPNVHAPLLDIMLDLASQAAVSQDDNSALAEKLAAAGQQFETSMLAAVDSLTSAIKAVADQLNHKAATRKALVQSLTKPSGLAVAS